MIDKVRLQAAVLEMLKAIEGEEVRPQLLETPERVQRGLEEMLNGYGVEIEKLFKVFDGEGTDQLVIVRNIHTFSFCEHHLIPIELRASVAYLPVNKVIGVSKMARLVEAYAHRLQLQERLTRQIGDALMQYLNPEGAGVVIVGNHLCMRARGVKSPESEVVTSVMLGSFRESPSLKQEVTSLLSISSIGRSA